MEFDNSFSVSKPIDEVWNTILDLETVVPCVPGAQVVEKTGDKSVEAEIEIRLGSMKFNYRGPAEVVEQDESAHRAVMSGKAEEAGGQGNADAEVEITLEEGSDGTEGKIHSNINVTGQAASMGEGAIGGVTEQLIEGFADCLGKM